MKDSTYKDLELFVPESLLSRLMGDEELMREVLDACLPDLATNLETFRRQLSEGEWGQACVTIHSIKGSAQNADFRALASLTLDIEEALKKGDDGFARECLGELTALVGDTVRAVEGYFSERN